MAALGLLALLGWLLGLPSLSGLGSDRMPMAPSTALLFALLGIATLIHGREAPSRAACRFGQLATYATGLSALLLLGLSSRGIYLNLEHVGFASTGSVAGAPIGHMSPITAIGFLLASVSFAGSLAPASRRWRLAAGAAATSLLLLSFPLLLAYLYGSPLFYASPVIPPAATTSLAFAVLAIALIALASVREHGEPTRSPELEPQRGVPRSLLVIFALFTVGIVTSGGLYFRSASRRYRAQVERELTAVVNLKADELALWRQERLADADILSGNTVIPALVSRCLGNPQDHEARKRLRAWLTKVQEQAAYDAVVLVDTAGVERVAVPASGTSVSPVVRERLPRLMRSGGPTFVDFYRNEIDRRIHLGIVVPMRDARGRALGAVVLRVDPRTYLYPLLERWPGVSRTAETLLVRREGAEIAFLSELRFRTNAALSLRWPTSSRDLPAVRAALGERGIVEGRDYRGTPVIAALRAVPASPWLLVARMDVAEAQAPLRESLGILVLLVTGLLTAAAAGVGLVWRQQRVRDLRERVAAEHERAWLHDVVARSLHEIYAFDPETLRLRFANAGACRHLGYAQEELLRLTPVDITPELTETAFRRLLEPLRAVERPVHTFETVHRRKDGSSYPVEVRYQLLDTGNGAVFLALVEDISERRRSQSRIRQLNRLYAVLSGVNQAILHVRRQETLLAEACRITIEVGGFRMAWIGLVDEENQVLSRVALATPADFGAAPDEFDDDSLFRGEPVDAVRRDGQRLVCNDVETDPRASIWRDAALERGCRAFAVLPLVVAGESVGIFVLHARESGFFVDEELGLLDELAHDLSFAIETSRLEDVRLRLAAAIEQSPVSVVITDTSGRIEYVNPAFTRVTGYTEREAVGASPRLLKSDAHESETYRRLWEAIQAGRTWRGELVNRRKDGSLYNQELTITPVRDQAGHIARFVAIGEDVTERKRTEAAILSEKAFSESMLDSLPGVFCLLDQTGRLLRWNHALETASGYNRHEIAALSALDLFPEDDRADMQARISELFARGSAEADATLLAKDGRRVPYFVVARRVLVDGVVCCAASALDVTAQRSLEEQFQQAQKMEAIGRLAGGVAHDFNNLLGVITGYGELAQRQLAPEHPVQARLGNMMKAAQRAAGLTRQLLAFSRKQVLAPKVLDLNAVIEEAHKLLVRMIGEDVELVVRADPDLGAVKADPGQMEQAIFNLAVNARDAMPEGGRLTLETANVVLDDGYAATHPLVRPGRYAMLAVSDTGVGMCEETQQRAFEPFFTTKPEGQGTGLGLSTVYGVVKQSGGHVSVYSEPGLGTTFKVYLPRVDEPAARDEGVETSETPGGHETILLVEDAEALRRVAQETLEELGYSVLAAAGAEEALDIVGARAEPIHLLLTDVVMPVIGGAELARRLRAERPGLHVLYMSGYTDGAISRGGVLAADAALLEKPFTGSALARAVRGALDRPAPS